MCRDAVDVILGGRTHANRNVRTHLTVSLDERTGMSGRLVLGIWTS